MLRRLLLLISVPVLIIQNPSVADEGMWLPFLLKKLNEADMQKAGFKLTADDLYSINTSSIKDAIVRLGGGFCTGEMVSEQGLMLTNHHCGFESIQEHSSVENDYLTNGFWAKKREEELPNPGLTVSFLIRIEDVTSRIYAGISDTMNETQRGQAVQKLSAEIMKETRDSAGYKAEVKSLFKGNEYYLFIYQVFRDVRLVGAPPSSIGKFGGDTDNWMWPRHTGDFSLFRVYMSKDGKPAEYSPENIPYKPKHFLPVSLAGIKQNDFSITYGYPGNTDRYLTSAGVKMALEQTNPTIIKIREKKLAILKEDMNSDPAIRIKYSAKYYTTSNYYKYFIGQNKGLQRMRVEEKKHHDEDNFKQWANSDPKRKIKYGTIPDEMEKNYLEIRKYNLSRTYLNEAVFQGAEILLRAFQCRNLNDLLNNEQAKPEDIKAITNEMKRSGLTFFKDYHAATDQKLYGSLLELYYNNVPKDQHPEIFNEIKTKYKLDFNAYAAAVYKKTIFCDSSLYFAFLENPSGKKLKKDPVFLAIISIMENYMNKITPALRIAEQNNARAYRFLVAGLREMNPEHKYYPDANNTMRLSYGKVADYYPQDGVYYNYFTTLEGIMEKKDPSNKDYIVPAKLEELYSRKDYGRYGVDGKMNVCFITNNDITGGNSGSPVINANGELIGLAFDGNWEAMSGEIAYDPDYKRCINVDIRYVLFIIEKYAGASNLINELRITGDPRAEK